MKRIIAIVMAVLMIAAVFAACGDSNDPNRKVTTTVKSQYDDGFAKSYATSVKTDDNGNTTYEFTGSQYDDFVYDYNNKVSSTITKDIASKHESNYGEYAYIKAEANSVIIGLNPGEYDEETCKAEAPAYAEYAWSFFQSLEKPVSAIKVVYCNANDQSDVYGSFDFTL